MEVGLRCRRVHRQLVAEDERRLVRKRRAPDVMKERRVEDGGNLAFTETEGPREAGRDDA
jgi:hypothetical protein